MQKSTFASLIKDHERVKGILEELVESSASAKQRRKKLLDTLREELLVHEKLEEELVYPALERRKATRDLTLEGYQEHHVVDLLVEELESLDFDDKAWKAKLTVLQENLLHHLDEEESHLFPQAEQTLDDSQLRRIEQQLDEARKA